MVLWSITQAICKQIPADSALPHGVVQRIFCAAGLAIEGGDDKRRMVDHPFVPALKAGAAVSETDEMDLICALQHGAVLALPAGAPAPFKPLVGTGADQPDGAALLPELQKPRDPRPAPCR